MIFGHRSKYNKWLVVLSALLIIAGVNYLIRLKDYRGPDDLPRGYSLDSYKVERILETSCRENEDCEIPAEYLVQSRCPFRSICLNNNCTVICPSHD
jgi:hypothetical protein